MADEAQGLTDVDLENVGIRMPVGFPVDTYNGIYELTHQQQTPSGFDRTDYVGGWNGLAFRARACFDAKCAFQAEYEDHGGAPQHSVRYRQERALFRFYSEAVSAVECFCYAFYWIGKAVYPQAFKIDTNNPKKQIVPSLVRDKFNQSAIPGTDLANVLGGYLPANGKPGPSASWATLKHRRNVLSHRRHPPRTISTGPVWGWDDPPVELEDMFVPMYDWLLDYLGEALPAGQRFIQSNF